MSNDIPPIEDKKDDDIPTHEPKVLTKDEIPEHVKRVINEQSAKIEKVGQYYETTVKEVISLKTDMKDMRTGLGPLFELAETIKQAQQQQQPQQPQQPQPNTQQTQGSPDGLPLPNIDLNSIQALATAAGNILQTLSPFLQQAGIIPSGNTEGITSLLLDNNKRFNKWVDLLVNKTLNKAIGLTLSATEQQIIESTEMAQPTHELS